MAVSASLAPLRAAGGDWHRDRNLVCSDCHTMHNSKGGLPMRYDQSGDAAAVLLRAESATAVCLACHVGERRGIDVAPPTNWDPPGGGFPSDLTDPLMQAHSLGTAPVLPPDGDTPVVMTCVTCHDPHGNGAYRNLRASPSGTGRSPAAPVVWQAVTANGSNADVVYTRANVRYVSGMSQWCMDCHNLMQPPPTTFHSWDRTIAGSSLADFAAWSAVSANRVPSQNATGAAAPHPSDQVFCLSCHKAHGSPNGATLIYADALSLNSTCQQCHNQ